eukprot:m.136782 g.136782  ORF g.136782 m.136782 type:complete len:432 (+) comp38189_c0_seq1:325-1620(+)
MIRRAVSKDSGNYSCSQSSSSVRSNSVVVIVTKPKFAEPFPKGPFLYNATGRKFIVFNISYPGSDCVTVSLYQLDDSGNNLKKILFFCHRRRAVYELKYGPGNFSVKLSTSNLNPDSAVEERFLVLEHVSSPNITEVRLINKSRTLSVNFTSGPLCDSGYCDSVRGFWVSFQKQNLSKSYVAEVNGTYFTVPVPYSADLAGSSVSLIAVGALAGSRSAPSAWKQISHPQDHDQIEELPSVVTPTEFESTRFTSSSTESPSHLPGNSFPVWVVVVVPAVAVIVGTILIIACLKCDSRKILRYFKANQMEMQLIFHDIKKFLKEAKEDKEKWRQYRCQLESLEIFVQKLRRREFCLEEEADEHHISFQALKEDFEAKVNLCQCKFKKSASALLDMLVDAGKPLDEVPENVLREFDDHIDSIQNIIQEFLKQLS